MVSDIEIANLLRGGATPESLGFTVHKQKPITLIPKNQQKKFKSSSISAQLKRRKSLPTPLKIITSPLLTTALVGSLITLGTAPVAGLGAGLASGAKATAITGTGLALAGTVAGSPTLTAAVKKRAFEPLGAGVALGESFESGLEKTKSGVSKVKDFFSQPTTKKAAGITAAAATAATAGGLIASKALPAIKERFFTKETVSTLLPQDIPLPGPEPVIIEPLTAAEKPNDKKEEQAPEKLIQMPDIINKINVNPEINVKISRRKKFINQQVLIS